MAQSKYFPDLQDGKDIASVEPIKSAFEAVESDYEQMSEKVTNLDNSVVGLQTDKAEKEDFDALDEKVYNMDITLTSAQVDVQKNREAIDTLKNTTASKNELCYSYLTGVALTPSPESDFEYDIFDGEAIISAYKGSDATVVVPGYIAGVPVSGFIGNIAFCMNDTIQTVYLPKQITELRNNAFSGCTNLKNVVAYKLEIGPMVFSDCQNLKNLNFAILSVAQNSFSSCSSLTDIDLSQLASTKITAMAFRDCSALKNLIIPNGVTDIENRVVYNCTALESITIPPSVTSIYHSTVSYNYGLAFENIPDDTIFYVEEGSYADTYCKAQGFNIRYTNINPDNYAKTDDINELNIHINDAIGVLNETDDNLLTQITTLTEAFNAHTAAQSLTYEGLPCGTKYYLQPGSLYYIYSNGKTKMYDNNGNELEDIDGNDLGNAMYRAFLMADNVKEWDEPTYVNLAMYVTSKLTITNPTSCNFYTIKDKPCYVMCTSDTTPGQIYRLRVS